MITETLANGYSSEITQRELSDEYQHDSWLQMVFKNLCILKLRMKEASALEGLNCLWHMATCPAKFTNLPAVTGFMMRCSTLILFPSNWSGAYFLKSNQPKTVYKLYIIIIIPPSTQTKRGQQHHYGQHHDLNPPLFNPRIILVLPKQVFPISIPKLLTFI